MFADFALSLATPEVTFLEIFHICRMDGPVVAFTVGGATGFNEAVVEREIVADAVPPPGTTRPEVGIVVQNVLVDIAQDQFLVRRAQNSLLIENEKIRFKMSNSLRPVKLQFFTLIGFFKNYSTMK